MMRRSFPPRVRLLSPLAVGLALGALPATAADQAGVSAAVRGEVALNRPQAAVGRQVVSGEAILLQDAIRSGPRSGMQILLLDETVFTIGPDSEMVVDEFVYDPQTSAGRVSAEVSKGVFRFVTGRVAHENPSNMNVRLPSGTLGVRGTIVAGRVDPANQSSLLVLLGEGHDNDTGSPASAFEACNAGVCKQVRRPGYGLQIDGPDAPPSDPFQVPLPEIDRLTQAVSDPAGWVETAKSGSGTDVAAGGGGGGAQDGDTRSATEVSGRSDAGGMGAAERSERRGSAVDLLDRATTNAQQDQTEEQNAIPGLRELASEGELPGSAPELPPDLSGLPIGGLSGLVSGTITSFADVATLGASGLEASFQRSGVLLDDGGAYDFYLDLNFRTQTASMSVLNIHSPSLGLQDAEFGGSSSLNEFQVGIPFAFVSSTITDSYSSGCASGCDAIAGALLVNGPHMLAEQAAHIVEILPGSSSASPVMTSLTPQNVLVPRD